MALTRDIHEGTCTSSFHGHRARRPWPFAAAVLVPVVALLLLGACSPVPNSLAAEDQAPQAVPLMSAPCVKAVPLPYRWEGYNEQLRDACVGPTHFRFPANMFRDQMGPDFQGNFTLVLMWPDLQPAAPGKLNGQPMEQVMARVRIIPYHVDRVPIETVLERSTRPIPGTESPQDPTRSLALRDRQPARFGLTPFYVNPQRFADFHADQSRRFGNKSRAKIEDTQDWYLYHDNTGRLTTLIRCDSHLEPDGYAIQGRQLVKIPNDPTNAQCTHRFVMKDIKADISISYPRALLSEWMKFETRARALFTENRIRSPKP